MALTLPRGRVDSDSVIQILLPSTHLHSDPKALHGLVATLPDDVNAYNFLFRSDADKLIDRRFFVLFIDH